MGENELSNELQEALGLLQTSDWDAIKQAFTKFNVPNSPIAPLVRYLHNKSYLMPLRRLLIVLNDTQNNESLEHVRYSVWKIQDCGFSLSKKNEKFIRNYEKKYLAIN